MTMIQDGTGTGSLAAVTTTNRLRTSSISKSENLFSVESGDGYNINTGIISLTGTADTAVLYLKNNESADMIIDAVAVGLGSGTQADTGFITVVRNPTAGTLIDANNAVDLNQNRNFGASKTLAADALKGADGETLTDGSDIALLFQNQSSRLFADLGFTLTKGDSIGIKIDPNLSSGSINAYAAIICHLKSEALAE